MTYPIIICEDNKEQLEYLSELVNNYLLFHDNLLTLALATPSPEEIQHYLVDSNPKKGIYFLDIDLNHTIDGITLAEEIRKYDVQAKIIFTSSHDELVPLTLKRRVEALGFVTKTSDSELFRKEIFELLDLALERFEHIKKKEHRLFTFSVGTRVFNINFDDVLLLESSETPHKLILHTKNGLYEFYGKLNEVAKDYSDLLFINRSCLANPSNMKEINYKTRTIYFDSALYRLFAFGKGPRIKEYVNNLNRNSTPSSSNI